MARRNTIVALLCVGTQPLHALSVQATATGKWGGALAAEAKTAIEAVQNAMQLCNALACEMAVVDSDSQSAGKTMDACDTTAGVSFIKPGDDTPVTAADFAIQGLVSAALKAQFPDDRFMGEEDAGDLRDDADLRSLALKLCSEFGGPKDEAAFIDAVDRGLEPNRGKGERVWVLDPIDGTKGFMTGQNFVVGLALLDSKGDALIGVMGVPPEEDAPPIMAAVKGHGLRWWPAVGDGPISYDPPAPEWSEKDDPTPPWLVSPQKSFPECAPFGADHAPDVICCGAMIKYYATAAGRSAGFVQYEEELKTWDHACGLICVSESGGEATDCEGGEVLFPDRLFPVKGGVVCASKWATPKMKAALRAAATRD